MRTLRRVIVLLIALVFVVGFGFWSATKTDQKIRREPLQKTGAELKSPVVYEKRGRLESGKEVTYDPKPRVVVVDARAGKYEFRWIGYDGKEKVIAYQRADAIDAVVSGSVEKSSDGTYVYSYTLDNQPSSAAYVSFFILQNFSPDTRPTEVNGKPTSLADIRLLKNFRQLPDDGKPRNFENMLMIGEMSELIHRFREGNWISFGGLPELASPGSKLQVKLISNAAPGLVGCSAVGGPRMLQGVGEHMPSELEEAIPGYDEFPTGYTVGPVAFLNSLTASQRAGYLVDRMVQFEKLGWITPSARGWYERTLRNDIDSALNRSRKDLDSEQISSEVFAMIQAVRH